MRVKVNYICAVFFFFFFFFFDSAFILRKSLVLLIFKIVWTFFNYNILQLSSLSILLGPAEKNFISSSYFCLHLFFFCILGWVKSFAIFRQRDAHFSHFRRLCRSHKGDQPHWTLRVVLLLWLEMKSPCHVLNNVLRLWLLSKLKFQLGYYIHFLTNTLIPHSVVC